MSNEDLLKKILDSSNQHIQVCDLETYEILYANKKFLERAYHKGEPFIGVPCYKYIMNFDEPCPYCPVLKLGDETSREAEVEIHGTTINVKTELIEWNGRKAFIEYTLDITKEKQKNSDKISSLNKILTDYQDIITNAGLGVWHIILQKDEKPRMQVNDKMAELLDITAENLTEEEIYSSWYDRITPEALPSVTNSVNEMIDGRFSENTYKWNHPSKGEIYVRCGGTCVTLPGGKMVLSGYHAEVTDIVLKEQKQKQDLQEAKALAEARNHELAEKLEIINTVSKSFNSIYYIDLRDFSFVELGTNLEGVKEIVGSKGNAIQSFELMYQHLVSQEFVPLTKEFTNLYTINERLKNRQWISHQFKGPLNGWFEGLFIAASRDENGNCNHVIWATRNIDENKRKELSYQEALEKATAAAESANAAKTRFLFNMSHDIRTPMNAIIGYTDLLEKHHTEPEKCYDYINKIRSSSDFLLSLINNVLEMARIESGKATLDESVFRAGLIQEEIFNIYEELFRKKNIRYERTAKVQTKYIYGDVVKIKEIFLNIISNAYKYTPEGGSISIHTVELPYDKPGYCKMQTTFTDTGIGMSKDFLSVIFEEFSRERNTTDDGVIGTGLGMPIVKKLIDMMGGEIHIDSEMGKGTVLSIILYHKIGEAPNEEINKSEIIDKTAFEGKRILLAEDNDLNAEIAQEILKEMGFAVDRAVDGISCVDIYQKAKDGFYDLILMDVQMPNMNGFKATKSIRAMENPAKNQIPIIAMTANAFDEDKKNALSAGMNAHLAKPIVINDLIKTLSQFIQK